MTDLGLFDQKINGVGVPLELNYLLGNIAVR